MKQRIADFVSGRLSPQERNEMKQQMVMDAELAEEIRVQKLELLVRQEMDKAKWQQSLKNMEQEFQQQNKRRRFLYYVSAVAAVFTGAFLAFHFFLNAPIDDNFTAINLTKDFNTQTFKSPANENPVVENLVGNWAAIVNEDNEIAVKIELNFEAVNQFSLSSQIFINDVPRANDKITANGNWQINTDHLALNLDPTSIKTVQKKNPFEAGILELWLKENRLFKKPNEIILLNDNSLVLRFNQRQGLELRKQ